TSTKRGKLSMMNLLSVKPITRRCRTMYNGDMSTYYAEKFYTMGKRIEARLVALDMNQTDLHDELRRLGVHVSRSFISQLIGDKKSISAENLPYLARALETTTDHLLLLRDDPEPYTEKE